MRSMGWTQYRGHHRLRHTGQHRSGQAGWARRHRGYSNPNTLENTDLDALDGMDTTEDTTD